MPQVLGIVAEIMLDRGRDALLLHALDIADGDLAGQEGILAEVFEVTAVHRSAIDVNAWAKQKHGSAGAAIAPKFFADTEREGPVP